MIEFFNSSGILKYTENPQKLVVQIDKDLVAYYRKLCPKAWNLKPSYHIPHITVLRAYKESTESSSWGKYEGVNIDFKYEVGVTYEPPYAWIRVVSKRLERIRLELDLPIENHAYDKFPPAPYRKYFHFTIGNSKC